MGFMNILGSLGKVTLEKAERMKKMRDEFRTYDDDKLKAIYGHGIGL